jgi:hypothetical protein
MNKNRYINTKFWDDDYIGELNPHEKLVFIYLLTNANTNIAGVYEITIKKISWDTAIDREEVKQILSKFVNDCKIEKHGDYVVLINFFKHQDYKGKRLVGADQIIRSLPKDVKELQSVKMMQENIDTLSQKDDTVSENEDKNEPRTDTVSIGYEYGIDTLSPNSNSNSNSNAYKASSIKGREEKKYRYPISNKDPELIQFFINNGSDAIEAAKFYDHFASQDWQKKNGMKISSWEPLASLWIHKSIHDPTLKKQYDNKMSQEEKDNEEARIKYGIQI